MRRGCGWSANDARRHLVGYMQGDNPDQIVRTGQLRQILGRHVQSPPVEFAAYLSGQLHYSTRCCQVLYRAASMTITSPATSQSGPEASATSTSLERARTIEREMSGQGGCRRRLRSDRGSTVGGAHVSVAPFGQIRSPAGRPPERQLPVPLVSPVAAEIWPYLIKAARCARRGPTLARPPALGGPSGHAPPSRQSPAADHVRLIRQASGAARCRLPGAAPALSGANSG